MLAVRNLGHLGGMTILDHPTSDDVLDAAYDWLCRRTLTSGRFDGTCRARRRRSRTNSGREGAKRARRSDTLFAEPLDYEAV